MKHLYYTMDCEVTIGRVDFKNVHSVLISQSIKKLSKTATIVIPRAFSQAIVSGKKKSMERENITDYIKVNDAVSIKLGYNNELHEEFKGYVTHLGADVPLKIVCEDAMSSLKKTHFTKTFKTVALKDLLAFIAPGHTCKAVDNIDLGAFTIHNKSGFQVLEDLRKDYGLHAFFKDGVLHVGFPISFTPTTTHRYVTNKNIRAKKSDLKFVKKEDIKLLLQAISVNKNGERLHSSYGDKGGTQRTLHVTNKTQAQLDTLVEKNYKSLSFDGYQGTLHCWGYPRTLAGDAISITDPKHSERDGRYLIEAVTIKFNASDGFLRENHLSLKL